VRPPTNLKTKPSAFAGPTGHTLRRRAAVALKSGTTARRGGHHEERTWR
jgi:hypothetical protein